MFSQPVFSLYLFSKFAAARFRVRAVFVHHGPFLEKNAHRFVEMITLWMAGGMACISLDANPALLNIFSNSAKV